MFFIYTFNSEPIINKENVVGKKKGKKKRFLEKIEKYYLNLKKNKNYRKIINI